MGMGRGQISACTTLLNGPFSCFSATRGLPAGIVARSNVGKAHDLFTYDADSNGPHEHEHHAPKAPIAHLLTSAPQGGWGGCTELVPLYRSLFSTRRPLFNLHSRRHFASKFTVTDSRDAVYEAPDFTSVARPLNEPEANRAFSYLMVGATGVLGGMTAKSTVMNFLSSWSASSEALAMAQVEVDLSAIPEGKSVVIKWRGKPIFIRHRTPAEVEEAATVPLAELRDPQEDADRTQKPEWIIMVGICTHLGCVPLANSGDYNGWFCPCQYSLLAPAWWPILMPSVVDLITTLADASARDRRPAIWRFPSTSLSMRSASSLADSWADERINERCFFMHEFSRGAL